MCAKAKKSCTWKLHKNGPWVDEVWATECDNDFIMADGTPTENEFKWCCFCGGRIIDEVVVGYDDDDE